MESIRSFIRVSDDLFCSGQPTREEFAAVRRSGVHLVVNLAMPDSDFALPDEREVVESLGMEFVHIPVLFSAPTVEHFLRLEGAILAHQKSRVLVHCALNWRASSFVALYAERHLGWTREQADALRGALWEPDDTWSAWSDSVRRYHENVLAPVFPDSGVIVPKW